MDYVGDSQTHPAKVIKPAKKPSWTKGWSLETYTKQVNPWSEINKNVPVNINHQNLIESLKVYKEIKNLQDLLDIIFESPTGRE